MSRYLVTGGCGFIGNHLVRHLLEEHFAVTVVDDLSTGSRDNVPDGVHFVEGDIRDQSLMTELLSQADGCFHLAAIPSVERCSKEWQFTSDVNALGTISVFESAAKAARGHACPVLYASSAAVYGAASAEAPLDETMPIAPISSYGVDKFACEHYGRIAWRNYQVPNVGLRLFNVYGEGQPKDSPYSGVITHFIRALEQKKPLTIFGGGNQSRDFVYVGDVVRAMVALMRAPMQSEIYNICTNVPTSILSLAQMLKELFGDTQEINYQPERLGDIPYSLGSNAKLYKKNPEFIYTSLKEGLEKTLQNTCRS